MVRLSIVLGGDRILTTAVILIPEIIWENAYLVSKNCVGFLLIFLYYVHFTDNNMVALRLGNLPKATERVNNRLQIFIRRFLKLSSHTQGPSLLYSA